MAGIRKGPPLLLDYRASIDDQGRHRRVGVGHLPAGTTDASLGRHAARRPCSRTRRSSGRPTRHLHNIGLGIPYALPNNKLTAHWLVDTPLPAAWIRAPGRMQNTFGNESFLDEIAAATNVDPFEIRKRHLTDSRGLELLERLRQFAKWEPRGAKPRDTGAIARGRGVSYAKYELVRTYVGIVADVTVDRTTGRIKVDRVFVVHDCGQIINPDGLRNQIEGNVVQTVSRSVVEKLTFSRSAVTSLNWGSYPILTFPNVPEVVIDLIDRPNEVPWGAGEPTTSVVPSAIANAVFDATGARLRSVPFRPRDGAGGAGRHAAQLAAWPTCQPAALQLSQEAATCTSIAIPWMTSFFDTAPMRFRHEVDLDATPAKVFAIFDDESSWPKWFQCHPQDRMDEPETAWRRLDPHGHAGDGHFVRTLLLLGAGSPLFVLPDRHVRCRWPTRWPRTTCWRRRRPARRASPTVSASSRACRSRRSVRCRTCTSTSMFKSACEHLQTYVRAV